MALTRWFLVLLAVGAVPIIVIGQFWVLLAWVAMVLAATGVDLALAASPRRLAVQRVVPARGRLGEPIETSVLLTNLGPRAMRALVRDAWPPSAQ